jgi:hypothetical protein
MSVYGIELKQGKTFTKPLNPFVVVDCLGAAFVVEIE